MTLCLLQRPNERTVFLPTHDFASSFQPTVVPAMSSAAPPPRKVPAAKKHPKTKWTRLVKHFSNVFTRTQAPATNPQPSPTPVPTTAEKEGPGTTMTETVPAPTTTESPSSSEEPAFLPLMSESLTRASVTGDAEARAGVENQNLWRVSTHSGSFAVPESLITFYTNAQAAGAEWIWAEYGTDAGMLIPVHSGVEVGTEGARGSGIGGGGVMELEGNNNRD